MSKNTPNWKRNFPGIEQITSESVQSYLVEHGWQQQGYQDTRLHLYTKGQGAVVLPAHPGISNFHGCLAEAIDALACEEDRPTYVVFQEFLNRGQK